MFLPLWSLLLFILTSQPFFFLIKLTRNHHFLCTRGIFQQKSFQTFCLQPKLWWSGYKWLTSVTFPRKCHGFTVYCRCGLTLVLAVAVSVLMSQLTIGARPVTWCLLAGQEDHTQKEKWMHREGTKWTKLYFPKKKNTPTLSNYTVHCKTH